MKLRGNLVVELTRWCNLECEHCLRGDRQRIQNKYEYMAAIVSHFESIDTITFTGGEPTLKPGLIGFFIDACRNHCVPIGNYYIATNAVKITHEFLRVWERLHHWCDDNEISSIGISNDQFHVCGGKDAHKLLDFAEMHEFNCDYKYDKKYFTPGYDNCIAQGRAKDWPGRELKSDQFIYNIYDDNTICYQEEVIYLNCKGNLIRGCDWSFENQDKKENIISHVFDFQPEMIFKYGREEK